VLPVPLVLGGLSLIEPGCLPFGRTVYC